VYLFQFSQLPDSQLQGTAFLLLGSDGKREQIHMSIDLLPDK
jgi:hypothetical protein